MVEVEESEIELELGSDSVVEVIVVQFSDSEVDEGSLEVAIIESVVELGAVLACVLVTTPSVKYCAQSGGKSAIFSALSAASHWAMNMRMKPCQDQSHSTLHFYITAVFTY